MRVSIIIHAHVLPCTLDTVCDTLLGHVRLCTSRYVHIVRQNNSRALLKSLQFSLLIQRVK